MLAAPIPSNESERIERLRRLGLLDTPPEERFDRVTRIARRLFDMPMALVSLVDSERQWFKSHLGIGDTETERSISFCGHAIAGDDTFVVTDAFDDDRFFDNPLVTSGPEIRFYAGQPLRDADGYALGTLCVLDEKPRLFSDEDRQMLRDLAAIVEEELLTFPSAGSESQPR